MGFADLLRSYREHAGLRKTDLAKKLSVSFTAVHNWESGKNPPPPERVTEIIKLLGIHGKEAEDLLNSAIEERMNPNEGARFRSLRQQNEALECEKESLRRAIEERMAESDLPFYRSIPSDEPDGTESPHIKEKQSSYSSGSKTRYVLEITEPLPAQPVEKSIYRDDHVLVEEIDDLDPAPYDQRLCIVALDGKRLVRQIRVMTEGKSKTIILKGSEGVEERFLLGERDFRIAGLVLRLVDRAL